LRPEDVPDVIVGTLAADDGNRDLMAVSHMPLLPALATLLTGSTAVFPLHGLAALERLGPHEYVERWRIQPNARST
jgi:phosphohistidine phosphatase SixA